MSSLHGIVRAGGGIFWGLVMTLRISVTWRPECAVTQLPYTKIAPMMQCAMGAIYTVMQVYCTYFYYSHSVRRESLLVYLVVSRPQKTDATALCGTPRHQTGTALLSSMKLKFNSVVLSFIFVPVAGCGAKTADSIPKSVQLDLKSGLPPA